MYIWLLEVCACTVPDVLVLTSTNQLQNELPYLDLESWKSILKSQFDYYDLEMYGNLLH
jgi:hypothetical protein